MRKPSENGSADSPVEATPPVPVGEIRWIETDLQRVLLRQDDTLVLFYPRPLSTEQRSALEAHMHKLFPGHECLLLDDGLRLGVLSHESEP